MNSKIVCFFAILAIFALTAEAAISPYHKAMQSASPRACKCMNWRNCFGDIDSSYNCGQSYIMVCCIIDDVVREPEIVKPLAIPQIVVPNQL